MVTAAEGLVVRAKLEVEEGPEGGPIIQALGVSLQQAHLVQPECEAEAEDARGGAEPGGPPSQIPPTSGFSQHFGVGNTRCCLLRLTSLLCLVPASPACPPRAFLPSFSPCTNQVH